MFKILSLWVLGLFALLQLIHIDLPAPPQAIDPAKEIDAPKPIMAMLKRSCYDCHSYQTHIPWYGYISPLSLEVKSHIKEGRKAVNFQVWGNYDEEKKQKIYKGIVKTIHFRMPLPMYLLMHKEAQLTKAQRESIKAWAKHHIKEERF